MMKFFFGKDHIYSEIFTEYDETYIISTIENNGNIYKIKVIYNIYKKISLKYNMIQNDSKFQTIIRLFQ